MRWCIVFFSACWFNLGVCAIEASSMRSFDSLLATMEQQLKADTTRYDFLLQRFNALQKAQPIALSSKVLTPSFLKRMKTTLVMQESEAANIELTVKAAQMEVELTQVNVQNLQKRSLDIRRHVPILPEVEVSLKHQGELLEIQQKRVRILQNTRDLIYKTVALTKEWHKQLQMKSQSAVQVQREADLHTLLERLGSTQQMWINRLENLSHQINPEENLTLINQITDIFSSLQAVSVEEKSNALHIQLDLEMINNELQAVCDTLAHDPPLMVLNTLQKPLENIFGYLQLLENLLKQKCQFLKNSLQLIFKEKSISTNDAQNKHNQLSDELKQCANDYQKQVDKVAQLKEQAESAQKLFTRQLHLYLSSRQDLPGLDKAAWLNILQKLKEVPTLFSNRCISLWKLILAKAEKAFWFQSSLIVVLSLIWIRVLILVKRLTSASKANLQHADEHKEVYPALFSLCLKLLDRYVYGVILCLGVCSLLLVWKVPINAFAWLFNWCAISLTFGIVIQICRFWLLERGSEEQQADNRTFYYRLRGILSIGRLVTLLSLVVHQLVLDYEVRNLVARLFMLFLFIAALALFRLWMLAPKLLEKYWSQRPRYLQQGIKWLSFLLPSTLLLNAIVGLMGYVQLAWAIVGYQSVLLLALCIYPLIRGGLNECFNWLSEQSIRRLRNGWLWSEAFLKPLYQLLKLFAFVSIIIVLFSFAGWREELRMWSTYPAAWFNKPLFTLFDVVIDTWRVIAVALMGGFVAWLARWTREFAYRAVFSNLKDLGLRNSLSVLTQYVVVFGATLVTLQLIGLTLSVLKYILSGFAIGLSFGLRDLLNNFVTGILLLVERPLKVGDWVTIGEYDGQVIYIGARSVTINTEDRQELMVPNADLFYKHFINWTRHDSIMRVTLPLLVSRKDDPVRIREVILEVIATIPKILTNPSAEVYFKATDQALLSFKIEYYVDLAQITSRSQVNSQFLFALWKRFSQENITRPELAQAVHLSGQLGIHQSSSSSQKHEQHA